jgi:predicted Fe-Mo cluster-binding NifX family protein
MRIAVSAAGAGPDAPAEERFGRCAWFVVFDEHGNVQESIANTAMSSAEGAGIKSTQLLLRNKIDVVLTGRVGPKAMHAMLNGGVIVYTGTAATVNEMLNKYLNGHMKPLAVPNDRRHAGGARSERQAT